MKQTETNENVTRTKREKKKKRKFKALNVLRSDGYTGSSDFILVLCTFALVIFGVIMVFSASYYDSISRFGNPYHFLIRQIIWVIGGTVCFAAGSSINYHVYNKFAPWLVVLGAILLALLFTPLGAEINNATRWLKVGPITVMPGELAKVFLIIFTAWFLSDKPERIKNLFTGILPLIGITGVYALLIIKQPNMSTAMTVVMIVGCMMIVAGLNKAFIVLGFAGVGTFILALTTVLRHTYWYKRFASFLDPFADPLGDGYQVVQSLLGMGSGGLFGVGLGKSVQKNLYLPEPQNDFILAIIGEELGFVGIVCLLAVYCIFIWRGVSIALRAKDMMGILLASGVVLMVAIQVILNVAVVTSSMPPTGINLPFISYGGNGLLLFMFATGILINVSRQGYAKEPRVSERENK